MASNSVNELVVKLRPEGHKETQRALDESSDKFDDTVGDVEDSTGRLDSFAKKWKGAGLVFAGTFGALTAAIASRMPIISEISNGLEMVLNSLALKIDEDVRPSLNDLTEDLADLSAEIDETEGAAPAIGTAIAGAIEIAAEQMGKQTISVDFVVEVGTITFEKINWQQVVEDFGPSDALQIAFTFSPMGVGRIGSEIGQQLAASIIDGVESYLRQQGRIAIAIAKKWLNNFVAGVKTTLAIIKTGFKTMYEFILNFGKQVLNDIADRFETRINQIIDALNSLPGFDIDPVSIGRFETTSWEQIKQRNRAELRGRIQDINRDRMSRNQELQQTINALQNSQPNQTIAVNGRTLAQVENEQRGERVANRGR